MSCSPYGIMSTPSALDSTRSQSCGAHHMGGADGTAHAVVDACQNGEPASCVPRALPVSRVLCHGLNNAHVSGANEQHGTRPHGHKGGRLTLARRGGDIGAGIAHLEHEAHDTVLEEPGDHRCPPYLRVPTGNLV